MVNIDSTKFGEIVIDRKTYYSDMIVWWDGKKEFRDKSHVFDIDEFVNLLKREPDAIVIGTGQRGVVEVPDKVKELAERKGIQLFVDKSPNAVDIFNGLVKNNKKAVGVIHTTC
jgi:hypothetical protein